MWPEPGVSTELAPRDHVAVAGRLLLVVEPSQRDPALWRFGLVNAPTATWGLLTCDPESGAIELALDETDVGLSHYVTAACLVRMAKDRERIEYDLTPQTGPLPEPMPIRRQPQPEQRSMTLGERAAQRKSSEGTQ